VNNQSLAAEEHVGEDGLGLHRRLENLTPLQQKHTSISVEQNMQSTDDKIYIKDDHQVTGQPTSS
jgi:hypothetical protein